MSAMVARLLFVLAVAVARASGQHPFPPLRSEEGRRLAAPALQEAASALGFKLEAVHTLGLHETGSWAHSRRLVEQGAASGPADGGRRLYSGTTRRDFVRLLLQLNVVAYTISDPYLEDVLKPVVEAGDSMYGPSVKTYAEEVAKEAADFAAQWAEVRNEGNVTVAEGRLGLDAAALDSVGVHALEFSAPAVGRLLVFRGSFSSGDFDNIKAWISGFIVKKGTAMLKNQWVTVGGLPWTEKLQGQKNSISLVPSESVFSTGSWWYYSSFHTQILDLAKKSGMDPAKVAETGYWEFTKAVTESVRTSLAAGEKLTMSGHSQGGARAALASMYLEKKYNEKHDTVTFAAVGGLCFSRDLDYTSGNMLADVDPYTMHDQVTEYVHPLDVYGHFDYDVGKVCSYGTTGLAESKARQYCEEVFGYTAAQLMVAGTVPGTSDLANAFARCRYNTHAVLEMSARLMNDTFLLEDGTTDGGCSTKSAIPKGDAKCPSEVWNTADGCDDELSCKSCAISTSAAGLACEWCAGDGVCRSIATTWYKSCNTSWVKGSQCGGEVDFASPVAHFSMAIIGCSVLSMLPHLY